MISEENTSRIDDTLTKDEECNYLRQRYNVLKAVKDKYQEELTSYKIKVQGVDSVILLLKESRQDNVNLQKRSKTLEAAVTNLQRRLSKNGLSCSLTLQETELFVPGASKQTLDNLAKENVRLRNLLKNENEQSEKKSTDGMDELKTKNEKLQSENNLLKRDLQTYEQKIAALSKEKEEKTLFEEDHTQNEANKNKGTRGGEDIEKVSVGCQTSNTSSVAISELSRLLKLTVKHCAQLDEQLYQSSEISQAVEDEKLMESNLKTPVLVDEDYQKLKEKLAESARMNERWQVYCQTQTNNIHSLTSELNKAQEMNMNASVFHEKEINRLKSILIAKDAEIQEIRKQAFGLSKEVQHYRKEMDNVEILKQQIQVCTEDFNTERKDREQAVSKAKALQDEVIKLKAELDRMKLLNNTELMTRFQQPQPLIPQNVPGHRQYEFVQERGPSHQIRDNIHIGQSPARSLMSMPQQALSPRIPFSDYNNMSYYRNVTPDNGLPQGNRNVESHSLPRQLLNDVPSHASVNMADVGKSKENNIVSMPTLSRRGGSSHEQYSVCPKCSKEFPDSSAADLMTHIDMCNA